MFLDEKIDRATYEQKYAELDTSLTALLEEKAQLEQSAQEEIDLGKRLEHCRKGLRTNELLPSFDRNVFESIVDKIIIGTDADPENPNPYKLTFVYKTGFHNSVQGKTRRQPQKKPLKNEGSGLCSYSENDTCGVGGFVDKVFLASKKCSKWQLKMYHLPTPKLFTV
ncbi:hypothetical protein [Brevibacillus nitrificans]|uniref:hypothetical protein n=1 Tax=Brevibacillus nitrificans TaxID=651560 RepID=UPI002864180E|nr:hypothetical protein [Brevibacillus nitrificans]MDR7315564.1 hypothetical protein [Brevibacillus nitrificans]